MCVHTRAQRATSPKSPGKVNNESEGFRLLLIYSRRAVLTRSFTNFQVQTKTSHSHQVTAIEERHTRALLTASVVRVHAVALGGGPPGPDEHRTDSLRAITPLRFSFSKYFCAFSACGALRTAAAVYDIDADGRRANYIRAAPAVGLLPTVRTEALRVLLLRDPEPPRAPLPTMVPQTPLKVKRVLTPSVIK